MARLCSLTLELEEEGRERKKMAAV